jgi:hypothetical protein
MKMLGHVARMGEARITYRILVGKSEGKTPLQRPKVKLEDNIKMYLKEINKANGVLKHKLKK